MSLNLKPETLARIDEVITHYRVKRSATLPLLHLVQEDQGYISSRGGRVDRRPARAPAYQRAGVVTFYPMFRQQPIGRRHVKICRTLSCALNGGYKVCEHFEKEFGTHVGHSSADGEVHLEFVECLASCGSGPVVMIDDDLHENVDTAKAAALAAQLKAEAAQRR
ncbi:MAG: NAD(P)H-dependent oxidoreductase subunit E [Opitutaceae bacterium]|nr:NAD(P)H-dependent oxidoreductase subunit E [Opitutaceae bacterium]